MRTFDPSKDMSNTLPGRELVQHATVTIAGDFHHDESLAIDNKLRQRQVDSNPILGTLTITTAPDATCAFNNRGDPAMVCPYGRRCSWESGELNVAFCGAQSLHTTCYDYTALNDLGECDRECLSNRYNGGCTLSFAPSCVLYHLGNSISIWGCMSLSTSYRVYTIRDVEERDFSTITVVDGTPLRSPTDIVTFTDDGTSTADDASTTKPTDTDISDDLASPSISRTITQPTHDPNPGPKVGTIVGGVLGGLAIVAFGILGVWYFWGRQTKRPDNSPPHIDNGPAPHVQQI
ncbi:hypothetical protein EDB82DRAFT_467041 [Fusarium venenatum]|uniref:uncharacterized protein n=1 Tax=Fusarium venenatum TaxID=56646 RepID=UPI001E066CEB|nr:hypothetical protein EDB82DRAFT_467041 [Fusarium venenatum]